MPTPKNNFLEPAKRDVIAGLQSAFDLPYKGYANLAPLMSWEYSSHNAFTRCGPFGAGIAGTICNSDGNVSYRPTWAVEVNCHMDLGFLPPSLQFFSISGRPGWYGPKGDSNGLPALSGRPLLNGLKVRAQQRADPSDIRCQQGLQGSELFPLRRPMVAYRYWQNEFGLDHNVMAGICTLAANGQSTNSRLESTDYGAVTVKF